MLGCIQPMSSPMMNRMLGFCPCAWAGAGRLAIVAAVLNATSALQLVLNDPMIAFPFFGRQIYGPRPSPDSIHRPIFAFADPCRDMSRATGRAPCAPEIGRSKPGALCSFGRRLAFVCQVRPVFRSMSRRAFGFAQALRKAATDFLPSWSVLPRLMRRVDLYIYGSRCSVTDGDSPKMVR